MPKNLKNKIYLFLILFIFFIVFINIKNEINNCYGNENDLVLSEIIQKNLINNYFNLEFIEKSFLISYKFNFEDLTLNIFSKDSKFILKINIKKNISIYKYTIKLYSDPVIFIKDNFEDEKIKSNEKNKENLIYINSEIIFSYYKTFFKPYLNKEEFDKWYQYKKRLKELKYLDYKPVEYYSENLEEKNKEIINNNSKELQETKKEEKKKEDVSSLKSYYDYAKKEIIEYKRIKYIIIDPGHGGKDPGAIVGNVKEKDINLYISNLLYSEISKKFNDYIVVMTRKDDRYISLEDRVKYINSFNSKEYTGIMLSIHCNSNPLSNKPNGLEVYFLDYNIADNKIKDLVASENSIGTENKDEDFNFFINRILNENLIYASNFLAKTFFEIFKNKKSLITASKISGAPFYVIAYSEMPSILIELGYLSNPNDLKNLYSKKFIDDFVTSVLESIDIFIKTYNATKSFKN